MRFKVSQQGPSVHKKVVTCVAWIASDEIFSCGDDHQLVSWKFEGGSINSKVVAEFPDDFFPTHMQWHSRPSQSPHGSVSKQALDVLLITTSDGKFHLVSRGGRIEKSVAAHAGAAILGKWSYDGTALLTAGEDGLIKVWSRSGMLRSTAIRGNQPVFAASWSPDDSALLYSQGPHLCLQSLTTSSKPQKWQAHEGIILAVSWNQFHGLIISGGEDCRHKVWDSNGNPLYASAIGDYPITAVNWCLSGSYFAVGSFNTLKLCDKTGWTHSMEKIQAGSIYDIAWSSDGTQVVLACSSGSVLIAHTIEKKIEYNNYEVTLIRRKAIQVTEIGTDVNEILEIADRVIQLEFGFDQLVAVTPSQCHVYSSSNWNTPAIFDLKNGSISAVLLADKHFLLIEWSVLSLYSYQGRSLGTPKWKGMTSDPLYPPCVSICSDTLVVRNQSNHKLLHVLEVSSKKPITEAQPYTHEQDVVSLALNYVGGVTDRQMALIDVNRDLYLISVRATGFARVCKIAGMAQNIAWATDANVLACMLESTLSVWLCPNCVHYSDRKIIRKTRVDKDGSEFGKHATIVSVRNGLVTVRRGDGALIVSSFYVFFTSFHQHILNDRWEEAVSLCRIVQNETLWTCMAVMAIDSKQLSIAEEACAAIGRYDKVDYINHIKKLPNELERLAEMALLAGDLLAAEGVLLQNGLIAEAIRINLEMYNWNRALELSIKHKKLLSEVLESRKRYLEILGKKEVNQSFITVHANLAKAHAAKKEAREKESKNDSEKGDREKDRDKDENTEREKEEEMERQREAEKQKERERQKEKERERKEMERAERERQKELEKREREKQREIEREKQREIEREKQREIERLQREKQKEMERLERERLREVERERQKEIEMLEREMEKEKSLERSNENNVDEKPKATSKESSRQNSKESPKEGSKTRESPKEGSKTRESPKEGTKIRESSKDRTKAGLKEGSRQSSRENAKDAPKAATRSSTREVKKESSRQKPAKEATKERQSSRERTRDASKDRPKERSKDVAKTTTKDKVRERSKPKTDKLSVTKAGGDNVTRIKKSRSPEK